jgi:hypothetical protein
MTMKRWLIITIALILGCTSAFVGINYWLDPYCIFRCRPDRLIPVVTNERTTKYLFGYSYIPRNFDGILIGSSVSGNWNTAKIRGYKVYNASLSGGNSAEGALILNNVLNRGKLRLAIFIVHPAMGEGHEPKSGSMNPQEYWGSLGSIPLLQDYGARIMRSFGRHHDECDGYGVYDIAPLVAAHAVTVPQEKVMSIFGGQVNMATSGPEFVDEIAFRQYEELIAKTRRSGAAIMAVVPPGRSRPGQKVKRNVYTERLLADFMPEDIVVDADSSEFDSLRQNPDSFWDGLHMTDSAADQVIEAINDRLKDHN